MQTSDDTKDINAALQGFQGTVGPIAKNANGQVGGNRNYKYADLASIVETITPPMGVNGLAFGQSIEPVDGFLICTTRVTHASGQWIEFQACVPIIESGRNAVQDMGSAITYARRYSLSAALGLVADDDTDGGDLEGRARASQGGARSGQGVETGEAATDAQQRKYGVEARLLTEHLGDEGFQEFVKAHYGEKKLPKAKPADLTKKQLSALIYALVHKREGCEIEAAVTPEDFEGIYDDRKKQDE